MAPSNGTNGTDLYQRLGVRAGASKDEIRAAYRKLARQFHPDVRPGDKAAEERFKQVTAAYDVLGDEKKRARYDEFGEMGLREGFDAEQARAYQAHRSGFGGAGGGFDFGDMLGDLFGGGGRARSRGRGQDMAATVEIGLVEAVRGTELKLQLPQEVSCDACHGSGAARGSSPIRCTVCRGSGQFDAGGMRARCPQCGGRGQSQRPCPQCSGQGSVERSQPIVVKVPPGVDAGTKLRLAGKGHHGPQGAGDLLIETRIKAHPWFRKEGLDLVVRVPVTVGEMVGLAQVEVPTPTGAVKVRIPAGAQTGTRLRLKGRGVVRGSAQGDLYVELLLKLPSTTSEAQKAAAQVLEAAYDGPVRGALHF